MKKSGLILLLLIFSLSVQAQYLDSIEQFLDYNHKITKLDSANYTFYRKAYKGEDKLWHSSTYYADTKSTEEKGAYIDDSLTIRDGKFYTYHRNKSLKNECSYNKNNKVGLWREYNDAGKLIDSARYKSTGMPFHKSFGWNDEGKVISYGDYDMSGSGAGYETAYYDNGTMRAIGKYATGHLKDSAWTYFHPNGKTCFTENYTGGQLLQWQCFDTNGQVQTKNCDTAATMPEPPYDPYLFIAKNSTVPREAKEQMMFGHFLVLIRFVVDEQGKITDVLLMKGSYTFFNEEALRVVKRLPKWQPGNMHNQNVKTYYTLPVKFNLE